MKRTATILLTALAAAMTATALWGEEPHSGGTSAMGTEPEYVDSVVTITTTTVVKKVFKSGTPTSVTTTTTEIPAVQPDSVDATEHVPYVVEEWGVTIPEEEEPVPDEMVPDDTIPAISVPRLGIAEWGDGVLRNEKGKIVLSPIDPSLLDEKVIIDGDTVSIILPSPNYGRYDRGLFNFMFIPKGQWMYGLTASYGEFTSDDVQILSLIKNFNFKGKIYSLQPTVSYFFRSNQSVGLKFSYSRAIADLGGLSVDFDDDINFTLSDISYYSQTFTSSIFYRNYVGLGADKRFAIFNELDLAFGSGSSRFKRAYDGEPKDTKTLTSKWSLNFSPGLTMFIMDQVCFNVSFGVFGLHVTHDKQYTNGEDEGSRTSSGANFRFNLFNINFGLGVTI